MNKSKKIILTIFGYLVSLSLLVIVFKDTNFERVFGYLKKIDPFLVMLALVLNAILNAMKKMSGLKIEFLLIMVLID